MVKEQEEKLRKLVNKHGYLLQWRIKTEVENASKKWNVASWEHHWVNEYDKTDGYIDLIFEHSVQNAFVLIVECKRVDQGHWVFLVPEPDKSDLTNIASCFLSQWEEIKHPVGYGDIKLFPKSFESNMCVIRGEGNKDKPMLERIASKLLDSTYAVAQEEMTLQDRVKYRAYLPAIITSAELHVCKFDSDDISLDDGRLSKAEFQIVPFIRFRKSLTTESISKADKRHLRKRSLKEIAQAKERTILVINSTNLIDTLDKMEIM